MQPTERLGHTTPVGLCLGALTLHERHHHHTVREQPAIRRRDRYRHGQTRAIEVLKELGLPREISIAPGAETTHREVPSDTHAPYVVGYTAGEWLNAAGVCAP
jgi:SOS-response transcriptional repressor LexA